MDKSHTVVLKGCHMLWTDGLDAVVGVYTWGHKTICIILTRVVTAWLCGEESVVVDEVKNRHTDSPKQKNVYIFEKGGVSWRNLEQSVPSLHLFVHSSQDHHGFPPPCPQHMTTPDPKLRIIYLFLMSVYAHLATGSKVMKRHAVLYLAVVD